MGGWVGRLADGRAGGQADERAGVLADGRVSERARGRIGEREDVGAGGPSARGMRCGRTAWLAE